MKPLNRARGGSFVFPLSPFASGSRCFFDLSRANTPSTNVLPPDATAFDNAYLLDIGAPDSFRFPVGMTYAIPDDWSLAAHGTDS